MQILDIRKFIKMKNFIVIIIFTFAINSLFGANEATVIATGTGEDRTECINNALRNAIEQTFGTFISSNTTIINNEIKNDEIQSISSGFIKKYTVLSESENKVTVKAIVSLSSLQTFCKNNGMSIDFDGEIYGFQVKQQQLNLKGELLAFENLKELFVQLIPNCFEYKIIAANPIQRKENDFYFPIGVQVSTNKNIQIIYKQIYNTLEGLNMSPAEIKSLNESNSVNKPVEHTFGNEFSKIELYGGYNFVGKTYFLRTNSWQNPFFKYLFSTENTRPYYRSGLFNNFRIEFEGTSIFIDGSKLRWIADNGDCQHFAGRTVFWPSYTKQLPSEITTLIENTNIWFSNQYGNTLVIPNKPNVVVAYYVLPDYYSCGNRDDKYPIPRTLDFISKVKKISISRI